MNVEVRLFATLREHLPEGSDRTSTEIHLREGSTIVDVLAELGIPPEAAFLVLVNGHYESDKNRRLDHDCVLSVWPPIAGG